MSSEEDINSPMTTEPKSPISSNSENYHLDNRDYKDDKEDIKQSLEAVQFHRGLLSLKEIQERSFSLVNQALLRHKIVETHVKVERDVEHVVSENNNDKQSLNNNSNESTNDSLSFEEARRRFLSESSPVGGGRLAFSVENILAPGKFGKEVDGDMDQYGEIFYYEYILIYWLGLSLIPNPIDQWVG